MMGLLRRARVRAAGPDSEAGFGLVLVMGFAVVAMVLTIVAGAIIQSSVDSSREHATFDLALEAAETGIDQTLARLQADDTVNSGMTLPDFTLSPYTNPDDAAEERAWARSTIAALATSSPSLLMDTGQGEYLTIRPSNKQIVYSMAWVPSFANPIKSRLLKSEYIFAPYKPANAVLTQGDLDFSGSVSISNEAPAESAPVHTNGDVTVSNSSFTVTGTLTSSGSYSVAGGANVAPGSGGGTSLETVPNVDPRYVYETQAMDYPSEWYDLCPDGSIREPDIADAAYLPCSGTILSAAGGPATPFRGWEWSTVSGTSTWELSNAGSAAAGIYYVYQGDADLTANTDWNGTVITEALDGGSANASACNKRGGDISWTHTDITNYMPGLVLLADADLTNGAVSTSGSGLFAAGDQLYLNTSSSNFTGALIAGDQCPNPSSPSEVQGVTVQFDDDTESPIQDIIRTTLWLEFVGS